MMESPVGTTYELRSHSLLPVGPRMTDKADSCGKLSTALCTHHITAYLWFTENQLWIKCGHVHVVWQSCIAMPMFRVSNSKPQKNMETYEQTLKLPDMFKVRKHLITEPSHIPAVT